MDEEIEMEALHHEVVQVEEVHEDEIVAEILDDHDDDVDDESL